MIEITSQLFLNSNPNIKFRASSGSMDETSRIIFFLYSPKSKTRITWFEHRMGEFGQKNHLSLHGEQDNQGIGVTHVVGSI